jgi:hypothetical protein
MAPSRRSDNANGHGSPNAAERLWALVAQVWTLLCATALILESTLDQDAVHPPPQPWDPQAITAAASVNSELTVCRA